MSINSLHQDLAVADLIEFLRFASVSTDSAFKGQMDECAEWLVRTFSALGFVAEKFKTLGNPIVVGRNERRAGRPTVLIYGHYDVQPADPLALWKTPPFEPRIEDGVIYARGSADNKGQIFAHIVGVREMLQASGALPVNVIFLIEGEEEIGSPSLRPFVEAQARDLKCDAIVISDGGMVGEGWGTLSYGLRGLTAMDLRVSGPSADLHSGVFGGIVANPATALARLLATLHDADGKIAIEGFYDTVRPLDGWEREAWKKLPLQDKELLTLSRSPALFGEKGYRPIERCFARPTAEVNGFGGGYQGKGTKTIIPSVAMAKLTFRLVPDQKPQEIVELIRTHLRNHCPPGVTMEVESGHSAEPYLADVRSPAACAAQRALRATFPGIEPALVREGGSIPVVQTFKEVLGVETLLLGLALPDSKMHSPNENFPLENFYAGARLNRALMIELATEWQNRDETRTT